MKKQLLLKPLLTLALVMMCGSAWGASYDQKEISFKSSSLAEGVSTNGTFNSSYYKMSAGQYAKIEASALNLDEDEPLSSAMVINVACGTFGTWSGAKTISFTAQFYDKDDAALGTPAQYTTAQLNSTQGTYRGNFELSKPSDPSKISYLKVTFTTLTTGDCARLAGIKLTYTTGSTAPQPVINASNVTIESDATEGEIAFSVSNPVEGKSLSASLANSNDNWISNIAVDGENNKVTFDAEANTSHKERTASITLKYEGATDKKVTVTQKKNSVFSNLDDLVAAGEPTTAGEEVTVSFADVVIKEIITNGVYLDVYDTNNKSIEIYCKNVPTGWIAGGTVSATALTCPWKKYNSTWELCPTDWTDITYKEPATYDITISPSANGSVSVGATKYAAGVTVALTITPNDHYELLALSVKKSTGENVPLTEDKTFIMPACGVTVSATFKELSQFSVKYYSKNEFLSEETVYDGEEITDAPTPTAPAGWTFCGWTKDSNYSIGNTSPEMFEGIVTETANLYAVYRKGEENIVYAKVEANQTDWRGDYLIAKDDATFMDGSLQGGTEGVGAANTFVSAASALSSDKKNISEEWGNQHYVTIEAIDDADLSKGYVIKSHNETTPYFYQTSNANGMSSTSNKSTASNYPLSITFVSSNDIKIAIAAGAVLHYNTSAAMFRFYKDGGQTAIYLYKKTDVGTYTYATNVYEASISSAKYATLCLPFSFTVPEGVTAYTAEATDDGVTLTAIDGVVPANTGVILYSETAGTYTFTGSAETPATLGTNNLVGVTEATAVPEGSYILALDTDNTAKFFEIDPTDNTLAANKAYLTIPSGVTPSKTLAIRRGDATGIENIKETKQAVYIDLMGRKVANPTPGIYILDGKKVLVK